VADACKALGIDRVAAAKLLARWHGPGWITRVRRGLYAPVPLSSLPTDQVIEDPWVIVPQLFSTAYIGGATAAHHWDLTERLFRSVFVTWSIYFATTNSDPMPLSCWAYCGKNALLGSNAGVLFLAGKRHHCATRACRADSVGRATL
jgi:hypothetical protein